MSGPVTIKLTGFKELAQKLHNLGPKLEARGLGATAHAGAAVIKTATKSTHAFTDRSGHLRANIISARRRAPQHWSTFRVTVRWVRYRKTKRNIAKGRGGKVVENNPRLYGAFLEFGTSRMQAHPYMRPAFESSSDEAIAAMKVRLARAVEDAAK